MSDLSRWSEDLRGDRRGPGSLAPSARRRTRRCQACSASRPAPSASAASAAGARAAASLGGRSLGSGASAGGVGLGGGRQPRRLAPRPSASPSSSSRSHSASGSSAALLGPASRRRPGDAGAGDQALGDGVGDHAGEQGDGADRVVVARDLVVDLVGVAVGVEDRDDRDVELARLADGDVLLLGVDDPDRAGHLRHVADTAEGAARACPSRGERTRSSFLVSPSAATSLEVDLLELLEALQALVDGLEVGEHAAQPALVDVGHADAAWPARRWPPGPASSCRRT